MKTYMSFIILILGSLSVNAQTYKSGFRTDMCECLETESKKRTLTENAYKACLRETLPKYAAQIDAQIVEEDANKKYMKGQIARKDLLISMQSELIYTCDVYYQHLEYQRTSKILRDRENAKESDLDKCNEMVALTPNAMAYFIRAQVHFKLGNLKETENDINKSLSLNNNKDNGTATRHELLLLGSVYSEQECYSEAVTLYDKAYFGDLDIELAKLRALTDKKAGGSVANIPTKVVQGEIKSENNPITGRREKKGVKSSKEIENKSKTRSRNNTRQVDNKKAVKKKDTSLRKLFKIEN